VLALEHGEILMCEVTQSAITFALAVALEPTMRVGNCLAACIFLTQHCQARRSLIQFCDRICSWPDDWASQPREHLRSAAKRDVGAIHFAPARREVPEFRKFAPPRLTRLKEEAIRTAIRAIREIRGRKMRLNALHQMAATLRPQCFSA